MYIIIRSAILILIMDDDNCLQLNDDPIQFVPASVSKTTNVFYDEITGQVKSLFGINNINLIKQDLSMK